jgi:hypothetical protein
MIRAASELQLEILSRFGLLPSPTLSYVVENRALVLMVTDDGVTAHQFTVRPDGVNVPAGVIPVLDDAALDRAFEWLAGGES